MYADLIGLQGRTRQIFGWTVLIFSDLAFAAVTLFETSACTSANRRSNR